MTLNAYSIADTKAGTFAPPFFMHTHAQAIRAFTDLTNDEQTMVGRHPHDFQLFHIGTYDDNNGRLMPLELPNSLGFAAEYQKQKAQQILPFPVNKENAS